MRTYPFVTVETIIHSDATDAAELLQRLPRIGEPWRGFDLGYVVVWYEASPVKRSFLRRLVDWILNRRNRWHVEAKLQPKWFVKGGEVKNAVSDALTGIGE